MKALKAEIENKEMNEKALEESKILIQNQQEMIK